MTSLSPSGFRFRVPRRVPPPVAPVDLRGTTSVVTGASSGIGLETARALARWGSRVLLIGRSERRTEDAVAQIQREGASHARGYLCDFNRFQAVRDTAERIADEHDRIDLLINNAGLWSPTLETTPDGLENTFQVNHLSPFLFTAILWPRVAAVPGSRVVNVSSRLHIKAHSLPLTDLRFGGVPYSPMKSYQQSKLCNVLFTKELARRYSDAGVVASAVHPGDVATNVVRGVRALQWASDVLGRMYLLTPEEGARTTLYAATSPKVRNLRGAYFSECAPFPPSRWSRDADLAKSLWTRSEELVGYAFPS